MHGENPSKAWEGGRDRPDALSESGFMEAWMRDGRAANQDSQHADDPHRFSDNIYRNTR
jgi:hypothetical protein